MKSVDTRGFIAVIINRTWYFQINFLDLGSSCNKVSSFLNKLWAIIDTEANVWQSSLFSMRVDFIPKYVLMSMGKVCNKCSMVSTFSIVQVSSFLGFLAFKSVCEQFPSATVDPSIYNGFSF